MGFNYNEEYCKPFTLVFFRKTTDPLGKVIEFNTKRCLKIADNIWTHVGIVITREVCKTINPLIKYTSMENIELVDNEPYLWESTISNSSPLFSRLDRISDIETGKCAFGVQLRKLSLIFNAALNSGIDIAYTTSYCDFVQTPNLDALKLQFNKTKHPYNPFVLYSHHESKKKVRTSASTKNGTLFSSQFVTAVLQSVGALPNDENIDCKQMLPHELAFPSLSDNDEFCEMFKDKIQLHEIQSTTVDKSTCGFVTKFAVKLLYMGYRKGIELGTRELIQRLPVNSDVKKIIEEVVDNQINIQTIES